MPLVRGTPVRGLPCLRPSHPRASGTDGPAEDKCPGRPAWDIALGDAYGEAEALIRSRLATFAETFYAQHPEAVLRPVEEPPLPPPVPLEPPEPLPREPQRDGAV
jgi:hypothetical protein